MSVKNRGFRTLRNSCSTMSSESTVHFIGCTRMSSIEGKKVLPCIKICQLFEVKPLPIVPVSQGITRHYLRVKEHR